MGDQLSNDVTKIVDDIFQKKEESEMVKATEKALQRSTDTINELTESLEAKDQELNDREAEILGLNENTQTLEARITELEEEKSTFEAEKAEFETEKSDITNRAEEAESKIAEMEKDKLAEIRLNELKEAGVVAANTEDQASKVKEMSDEDFSSYKEELVAIRKAIVEELKASEENSNGGSEENNEENSNGGSEENNEENSEEDENNAANDSETAGLMHSVAAALNMEVMPNKDMMTKYKELGSQMAENIKKVDK